MVRAWVQDGTALDEAGLLLHSLVSQLALH